MENLLEINPQKEEEKIRQFIKQVLNKTKLSRVVIGLSGGIDSTVALYLLRKSVEASNIFAVYLPYFESGTSDGIKIAQDIGVPKENTMTINIKTLVDNFQKQLQITNKEDIGKIRLGNIMARVRMLILFDLAKKYNGLVCGTENKSEYMLGYFTRFGDEASDFEPIEHLYKNQVYQMAKYLRVPEEIIAKKPSANLWIGQSDESELGFGYLEADPVLYLYFEKKESVEDIEKQGYKNVRKIIKTTQANSFKHKVPYHL